MLSPAHQTKHIPLLIYPFSNYSTFHLAQLDDGVSNGTALWLGAQCLSLYLAHILPKNKPSKSILPPRVVELGSGIGLTALTLSALGWDVLATDIPHVISSVLNKNVRNNIAHLPATAGTIQIRELDWTIPPELWTWNSATAIASASPSSLMEDSDLSKFLSPPYDIICSADTVYSAALVEPLLRTFHTLSRLSMESSSFSRAPPVYLCLERRDPGLVDHLLADAKNTWGFNVARVPRRKLTKAMEKGGVEWNTEEWEGVEIWKLTLL